MKNRKNNDEKLLYLYCILFFNNKIIMIKSSEVELNRNENLNLSKKISLSNIYSY